ncbi:sensor histidine kinase [Chitinophaga polysaccharea]|uniref:sensor histidine kinase n=1 Tax=Chitinophaga polysaccharea TaxID=1293035 RepID=UPI001C8ED5F2|nr:histidine kinase [Chitinophaga polysaccharea]
MFKQLMKGNSWWAFLTSFAIWMFLYSGLLWYWYDLPIWESATDSAIHVILLGAAGIIISHNVAYYRPADGTMKFGYVAIVSFSLSVLWVCLSRWLLVSAFPDNARYINWLNNAIPIHAFVGWMLIAGIGFRSQMLYDVEEQQESRDRKEATEKIVREAELFKLRQQLQPHFLFNSLNSINALIMLRPKEARQMVLKLSDFLRGSLKREDDQWITLAEELNYLQLYLDIEKVRFGHRLTTNITSYEETDNMLLPPMLLQPVVENAIKFGLYDTTGDITISIKTWSQDNMLYIAVQNPFDNELQQPNKGTGFGLSSIQRRLYLLFARQDLLETSAVENIFTTTIKVPQSHDKSSIN